MEIDERRHSILNEVNQNRNVKISTLSKQMDVSRETIRKDIYSLAKQGLVSAVRGGAEAIVDDPTSRFDQRKAINQQAKQRWHNAHSPISRMAQLFSLIQGLVHMRWLKPLNKIHDMIFPLLLVQHL